MRFYQFDVTFQEVPDEVSLVFSIVGCSLRCTGCHSQYLWGNGGQRLDEDLFKNLIKKYSPYITCVCFLGGEWHEQELMKFLSLARNRDLKTCLYTGQDKVNSQLLSLLTYLKIGPYDEKKGGLNSPKTNQNFIEVSSGKNLNHFFLKETTCTH